MSFKICNEIHIILHNTDMNEISDKSKNKIKLSLFFYKFIIFFKVMKILIKFKGFTLREKKLK